MRVTAPPEGGKANAAVEALVAESLGLPKESVRVVAGSTSPHKMLEIAGLSEPEVRAKLEELAR